MNFEFDPDKSLANKAKHGIDFEEAQALWDDPSRVVIEARSIDEARQLTIGQIAGKLWVAVSTVRGDRVRVISVRRARLEERQWYENDQGE